MVFLPLEYAKIILAFGTSKNITFWNVSQDQSGENDLFELWLMADGIEERVNWRIHKNKANQKFALYGDEAKL